MRVIGVIPTRWGAKRLPGKLLLDLAGKSILERVFVRTRKAKKISRIIIATDDKRIFQAVTKFGGQAVMTAKNCKSGTDRIAEVMKNIAGDVVVNVQGDEPFILPSYLDNLVEPFYNNSKILMTTLAAPLPAAEQDNPNAVKVVCDKEHNALYFSRASIPYNRDGCKKSNKLLHLGIYAYRKKFLLAFSKWNKTPLEKLENLEQLRALEHGVKIKVIKVKQPTLSIDTSLDLKQARELLRK